MIWPETKQETIIFSLKSAIWIALLSQTCVTENVTGMHRKKIITASKIGKISPKIGKNSKNLAPWITPKSFRAFWLNGQIRHFWRFFLWVPPIFYLEVTNTANILGVQTRVCVLVWLYTEGIWSSSSSRTKTFKYNFAYNVNKKRKYQTIRNGKMSL